MGLQLNVHTLGPCKRAEGNSAYEGDDRSMNAQDRMEYGILRRSCIV
jgi:hypothetical protein